MSKFGRFILVAIALTGCSAFAQDSSQSAPPPTPHRTHTPQDVAERKLKRLSRRLDLTADQQEKLRPILMDEEKQVQSVDDDPTLTPQQKHRKTRDIHMASKSKMQAILTPEQQEKIHSGRAGGRGHNHRPPSTTPPPSSDQSSPQ